MTDVLRDSLRTILNDYPTGSSRPSRDMPTEVEEAFQQIEERLSGLFGVRASAEYEVDANIEFLDRPGKVPLLQFIPDRTSKNDRNPRLRLSVLFPLDMRGVFLLLTDVRQEDQGPDSAQKIEQRDRLRAVLNQETEMAWRFEAGVPRIESDSSGDTGRLTNGTLFHRFYEAGNVPSDAEIRRDLDGLLRLAEVYDEKFRSKNLVEVTPADRDGLAAPDQEDVREGRPEQQAGLAEDSVAEELEGEADETRNLLLYGPPGTGKTYKTERRAVELCGEIGPGDDIEDGEVTRRYRRLRSEGRIEFVTFHQSFGYEEFVEGIRPVMSDQTTESDDGSGDVEYQCEMGVFKRIALLAASEGLDLKGDDERFEARWRALQIRVEEEDEVTCRSQKAKYRAETVDNDRFRLIRTDDASNTTYVVEKKTVKRWWNKRQELGTDFNALGRRKVDSTLSRPGNFTPNWVMYRLLMEQEPGEQTGRSDVSGEIREASQESRIASASTYLDERREERGTDAFTGFENAKPYVLIIDEINRGNISKILGELITLLEPNKRLSRDDELLVRLPYSKETFGVPPNLHVLGTMNTADRSIALLDAALRRRFEYVEMMPEVEALVEKLQSELDDSDEFIALAAALLQTINDRIEFLYDRDHQIGHSYFMEARDLVDLRDVFIDRIIPLLQEYFYGSWHQIGMALGCPRDERGEPARDPGDRHAFDGSDYSTPILEVDVLDETNVLRMDHQDYEDELRWSVNTDFAEADDDETLRTFFDAILAPDVREAVRSGTYL